MKFIGLNRVFQWDMGCILLLLIIGMIINTMGVYYVGPFGWDDGAITLAYAKTLAETGKFALTACSEIVEGSSSLLFVLMMSFLHKIYNFNFFQFIFSAQLIAYVFVILMGILLFNELKKCLDDSMYRLSIVLAFSLLPFFTTESINGMEMTCLAFLFACYYLAFNTRSVMVYFLPPLILLVRFETIFYLGFSLLSLFVLDKKNRKYIFTLGCYTAFSFLLISSFRWLYFGDILPNTVWAKMKFPYSKKWYFWPLGLIEYIQTIGCLVIPALVSLKLRKTKSYDIGVMMMISFGIFALISGKNWGYDGRMFIGCLPLTLLVMISFISDFGGQNQKLSVSWSSIHQMIPGQKIIFWGLMTMIIICHLVNFNLHLANLNKVLAGAHYQHLLPKVIDDEVKHRVIKTDENIDYSFGFSPYNYRVTGIAIDNIRKILHKESIKFMVTDVGGLGLYSDRINVIDAALLTNRYLAKNGYPHFREFFMLNNPDVINIYGMWAEGSHIYEINELLEQFQPIVFDNNYIWIKKKYLTKLLNSNLIKYSSIKDIQEMKNVRTWGETIDYNFLKNSMNFPIPNIQSL